MPDRAAIVASYDAASGHYDRSHGDPRSIARFWIIEEPLRALCGSDQRVLELGCGTGRFLSQIPGENIGVDLSFRMLAAARRNALSVAAADAHQLPFSSGAFDTVVAPKGVFRYLDYTRAFEECARVLRAGGKLGVHQYAARIWSPRRPWRLPPPDSELHVTRIKELVAPACAAGFEPVKVQCFRSIRLRPYALRIPGFLRWPLWSHVVIVFSRTA